jgi:hypothetical protein
MHAIRTNRSRYISSIIDDQLNTTLLCHPEGRFR